MLYSIGYQKMVDVDDLVLAIRDYDVRVLIDVRSKPYGRKTAFNRSRLEQKLPQAGVVYLWWGRVLGGFSAIEDSAIQELADWQKDKVACLMCMEADPDQCHRKNEIGRRLQPLGVEVLHLPLPVPEPQRLLF